ncbi:sortase-associated OmpA-like protein PdsO [Ningiella sp. W23]|uniref:sortase-associated OmpA-like protein PdsO n=1 Tax=Ningiella sp. W23 TaxID=3023715 RepID=UPI003757C477
MKKLMLATALGFALSHGSFNAQANDTTPPEGSQPHSSSHTPYTLDAEHPNKTSNDLIGFGSGALAGALVGGPIGGVVGGLLGIFVANDINREHELQSHEVALAEVNQDLWQQHQAFAALKTEYGALEQSQMLQLANVDDSMTSEWLKNIPEIVSNIQFKTASFLIEDEYKAQLNSVASMLTQYPNLRVHISGYADMRGDSQYNRILSEQRATAVKRFLIKQRVSPEQILTHGQGELAANTLGNASDVEALFFDRKATIKLITEQGVLSASANTPTDTEN